MVNIKLHGIFENFIKTDWLLNVKTVGEAFEAIEANSNKLIEILGTMQEYLSHFIIYVDDNTTKYIINQVYSGDPKTYILNKVEAILKPAPNIIEFKR